MSEGKLQQYREIETGGGSLESPYKHLHGINRKFAESLRDICYYNNLSGDLLTNKGMWETFWTIDETGAEAEPIFSKENAETYNVPDEVGKLYLNGKKNNVFVFLPDEEFPRQLVFNQDKRLSLGDPIDVLARKGQKDPEKLKPNIFKRIARYFNKDAYKKDFDAYEFAKKQHKERAVYENALRSLVDGRKNAIEEEKQKEIDKKTRNSESITAVTDRLESDPEETRKRAELAAELKKSLPATLDEAFEQTDALDPANPIERSDYILVDGRPLSTLLSEAYLKNQKSAEQNSQEAFDQFLKSDAGKKAVVSFLANAIVGGYSVECYAPDKDMLLPTEPKRLSKEPQEQTGRGLTALQREQRLELNARRNKSVNLMKTIALCDSFSRTKTDWKSAFPDWEQDKKEQLWEHPGAQRDADLLGLSTEGDGPLTYVFAELVASGISPDNIDIPPLEGHRVMAVQKVLKCFREGDTQELARINHVARKKIADYIDEKTKGLDISYTKGLLAPMEREDRRYNEKLLRTPQLQHLNKFLRVAQTLNQDYRTLKVKAEETFGRNNKEWKKESESVQRRIDGTVQIFDSLAAPERHCARIAAGNKIAVNDQELNGIIANHLMRENFAKQQKADKLSFTKMAGKAEFLQSCPKAVEELYASSPEYRNFLMTTGPQKIAETLTDMEDGKRLCDLNDFKMQVTEKDGRQMTTVSFGRDVRNAIRAQRQAELQAKQQAPAV